MFTKHQTLEKVSGPTKIELPEQEISGWRLLNVTSKWLASYFLERPLKIDKDLDISESTFKSPIETEWPENNVVRVRHYKASDNFAVVVLPQRRMTRPNKVQGYNIAPVIASYLATNGISAYEVETPLSGTRRPKEKTIDELITDVQSFKSTIQQAVAEVRSMLDFVAEKEIGIIGISLGAIYASIVYGIDKRVSSACLVMGAGNLADMVFESEDVVAKHLRAYASSHAITREQLRAELKDVEPCNYTNPDKGEKLLMINGLKDRELPLKYAKELALAWVNYESTLLRGGHRSAILTFPHILPRILEHYQRTLE
ncbi:hypothetical protein HYX04_04775 [Candidatus Woesearchaeota archaeon]|nr:hypothetical protein [Candidatus Woesearchaeota archaeon]